MFNRKYFPAWLVTFIGGCWWVLEKWATIDFILGKISLKEKTMINLLTISSSLRVPDMLLLSGITWLYMIYAYDNGYWPFLWKMISLQEVCDKIFDKVKMERHSIYIILKGHRLKEELDQISRYVAQAVDIYGKRSPSARFEKINKDKFDFIERINQGASVIRWPEGYVGNEPKFIELSIKKGQFKKAIREAKTAYLKNLDFKTPLPSFFA